MPTSYSCGKIQPHTGKIQTKGAQDLMEPASASIPEDAKGIPEFQQFQRFLKNYKFVVYSYGCKGRDDIFEGIRVGPKLNLLYHEGNFIKSPTSAFGLPS